MNKKSRLRLSSASMVTLIACSLLLILPSLSLLCYIYVFGVNVIVWDEWEMIPFIQKAMRGTLSFSDLFAQHNEHRIPFARTIMLALGELTRYNTVAEMFFSWSLMCLTGLLIFYVYRKKFSRSGGSKTLLIFLPVSLLIFSFRQYEAILLGFACHIYLMVFGSVAAFSLLEVSKRIDFWFVSCLLGGILASFSFVVGLMVWPVGVLQILISKRERKLWKVVLWCLVGAIVFTSYFYGYVKPSYHPPLDYVLMDPVGAGTYFLTFVGAAFSFSGIHYAMAVALGLAILLIAAFVLVHGYKGGLLRRNGVWFSFILFVALSALATTVGRGGFGVEQALNSRYTPITILGIVGLYFLAVSVSEKFPAKSKSFGVHALLALIVVGLIVSYGAGLWAGQYWRHHREMGAYILMTFEIQSDENIRYYLYPPNSAIVKERAEFLEENKLNVFSEKVIDVSTLVPISSDTLFAIDTINGKIVSQQTSPVVINLNQQETITITGWAVDRQANDVASTVFITIDGKIDIPTFYGLDRPEISSQFKNPNFRFSGYTATFSSSILERGAHTLSIKIVTKDGNGYYYPGQKVDFVIQ